MNQKPNLKGLPKRKRPYKYKTGTFAMTASFRDTEIQRALIDFVGKAAIEHTQRVIAEKLGCSTSTIGKMVRIYNFTKNQ